jgi:hypothetical protein
VNAAFTAVSLVESGGRGATTFSGPSVTVANSLLMATLGDISLGGSTVTAGGGIGFIAGNNINGGFLNGQTISLMAGNTVGLTNNVLVNAGATNYGAIYVSAGGQVSGVSAMLIGADAMYSRINPDSSAGAVLFNSRPVDTASISAFEEAGAVGASTLSQSEERIKSMLRDASFEGFFSVPRSAISVEPGEEIVVSDDGFMLIE